MTSQKILIKMLVTRRILAILALFFILFTFSSCNENFVYPGEKWERIVDLQSVGFSKEGLVTVRAHIDSLPSTGIVVVVGGKILFENGNIANKSYIASVRKSILSMLFGNYVEDGTIDVNKTLADLEITDHGGLSDQE